MTDNLMDLIRKRHEGPAWILVDECGNGTGYNVKRHADAVGKFCDFWWLVVGDLAIIDGLVIPETWGILAPKNRVLRAHRKAPKRDATPVNRSFVAALTRRVTAEWVPKHQHEELKKTALEQARAEVEREQKYKKSDVEYERDEAKRKLADFERASGLDLSKPWQLGEIGAAVKILMRSRELAGSANYRWDDPVELVRGELAVLERSIARHRDAGGRLEAGAARLRDFIVECGSTASPQAPELPE